MYGVLGYSMLIVSGVAVDIAWDTYGSAGLRSTLPYSVPLGLTGVFIALVLPSLVPVGKSRKGSPDTQGTRRRRRPF